MTKPRCVVLPAASLVCLSVLADVVVAREAPSAPLANLCLTAEYIYAGSRLLAVAKGPLPTVALAATASSPNEASGNAPVAVVLTTPGGCPIDGNVVVQYSTGPGTATAGQDYTAVSAGSLTFPANTASGSSLNINVPLTNDLLDEDPETFTVNLGGAIAATVSGPATHTVTIVDDDPEPILAIADVSSNEPTTLVTLATHAVTLLPVSGRTVTVNYATGGGTATPQSPTEVGDYQPASGTLTFPAGTTSRVVQVALHPDDIDEPSETYFVNLTGAVNVNVAASDLQAQGTIMDTDPTPTVSVSDRSRSEGDEGVNKMDFSVTLSNPSATTITVNYATANGSAGAPRDYTAASGQIAFSAGETFKQPLVDIVTDSVPEPNEDFTFNLSLPAGTQNVTLGDAQGLGVIVNDDPEFVASVELTPGAQQTQALMPVGGAPAAHWYRLGQKPRSSYEVVIDATSGDVGLDYGLELARLNWDQTTVLQHAVSVAPDDQGRGHSKTLRWRNLQLFGVSGQFLRVRSTQCATDCGPDDVYRIRAFDTTYSISRFNNTASQVTVLQIHNTGPTSVSGFIDFWDATGTFLTAELFFLEPKASLVLNTSLYLPGQSGSITIPNTAGYGDLSGKAVAVEPATGYSFDTPMVPRPQ